MIPVQSGHCIAPEHVYGDVSAGLLRLHTIVAVVEVRGNAVLSRGCPQPGHVRVREAVGQGDVVHMQVVPIEQVHERAAPGQDQRRLFRQRSLHGPLRAHQPDRRVHADLFGDRPARVHVYDAAQAVHARGDGAIRHRPVVRGIEDGEQAHKVRSAIDRHAVERHQIVLMVAALNVDARVDLGVCLHARKHLHEMQRVGVSENRRHQG